MSLLLIDDHAAETTGPEQGVIEEARRHQRRRWARLTAVIVLTAAFIVVLAWAITGGSHASPPAGHSPNSVASVRSTSPGEVQFNVRLYPFLTVGQAGWCTAIEEDGKTGTSACGAAATSSAPLVMVQGFGECGARYSTTVAVTIPQVAAILVNGDSRVATMPLPGLPYGLRGARILTAGQTCKGHLPSDSLSPVLVPLDAQGHPLAQHPTMRTPVQATVRSWHAPAQPPAGSCSLTVAGLPGISARGGKVASSIRPYPGKLVGHAFLPCAETVYSLHGMPFKAMVVLDAADPHARVTPLPGFRPVHGAQGFFSEGGTLTAKRSDNAWLTVGQGRDLAQQIQLLRHLTATVN